MVPTGERLARKIRVRLLEPDDSLAHLTGLLHRAYKQHADRGLKALAAFQPEEVTRRRVADGECYIALYMGDIVGTIMFKSPEQTRRAWPGVPWFDPAAPAPPAPVTPVETEHLNGTHIAPKVASFSQFAVEPDYQGKGIGGELMAQAEARAVALGASELALSTPEPAEWLVSMYLRHGYRRVTRWQWNETNYISAIMSKRVAPPAPVSHV
jgi:GNAT superfamily N-acetyltransferase